MIIEHVIIEFVSLGKNSSPDKFETWQIVNVSEIRATSYTELRTCDHYISKHSHWWKRWSLCKFASHYAWGTNGVCQRKMDVKPTHIPTCHQIDNVFMVTWTIFKNCLLEVGLTQPWDTMALWTLTTVVDSILSCGRTRMDRIPWNSIWLRARPHKTSHYTQGSVTTLHTWFWRCIGMAFGHFLFGLSQGHGHGSWVVCEVVLSTTYHVCSVVTDPQV